MAKDDRGTAAGLRGAPAPLLGPRRIRQSWAKRLLVLALCLGFAAGCLAVIRHPSTFPPAAAWAGLILFGGGGTVFLLLGLTGNAELTLDETGFVMASPRRNARYEWRDVTPFSVVRAGPAGHKMVGFSIISRTSLLQSFNQSLLGAGAALPDIYTMRPEDLAALMNAYRDQALRRSGTAAQTPAPPITFRATP